MRSLHPDLKRSIKAAVRAIATDPGCGVPLLRELDGLWKYRVRRFRIVYAIDRKTRVIRLLAVGHRRDVYEELSTTSTSCALPAAKLKQIRQVSAR